MNKKLIISAVISALLLSGCAAENDVSQTAEISTTEAATTEEEILYIDSWNFSKYDSYEELMANYNKGRSANYVYPLPDIVETWEFKSASMCGSNYTLHYHDTENDVYIMLEIGYNSTYEKISDFFDGIGFSMGVENIEMYERYSVQHYTEDDTYSIIGITGEENIRYTLLANSDDETKDPVELLKEYKEILEL
jgi:hypothetical protein